MASDRMNSDKKPRKKRAKKDPKAPKRNMSAFLFFSNTRRHDVKKQNPNLSFSEIAKVCFVYLLLFFFKY